MFKLKKSVSLLTKVSQIGFSFGENVNAKFVKLEKKVEGTMVENWLKYWKTVFKDYKDVATDIGKEIRDKPTKAILIGSTGGLTTYFWQHNPNSTHFRDSFIKAANEIALMHPTLVREEATQHIKLIEKCYNNELIRCTSFGIFSLVWIDNYSTKCNKFETQCSYLQLKYFDMFSRVIDVGFLDTWWMLAKKMTDYDINY